ncbi:MAG: MotA/TolQ/ExbB proton channel family protein [Phycisphaerae bacterium]
MRTLPVYIIAATAVLALCFATIGFAQDAENGAENGTGTETTATNGEQANGATADADQPAAQMSPLQEAWDAFVTKWQLGGVTMWALAGLAVVGLIFTIDRLVSLRRSRIVPRGLADRANQLWQQGEYEEVVTLARRSRSTLGRVIVFLARHRNNSYEHLTAAAEDIAGRDFELQVRGNYPLNAVGTVAPLLGLLGTVFGLLGAFATIGVVGSMDDPSALAGDIGEALITTAAGLIVAIPTLILYHFFTNRTTLFAGILGEEVSGMIQDWFLKKADEESAPTAQAKSSGSIPRAEPVKAPPAAPTVAADSRGSADRDNG